MTNDKLDVAFEDERTEDPPIDMVLTVEQWSYRMDVNRSGMNAGDSTEVSGFLEMSRVFQDTEHFTAKAHIVQKAPHHRLEMTLTEQDCELTVPLEQFSLARVRDALKEYSAQYGMLVTLRFKAHPVIGRQQLDEVTFSFEVPESELRQADAGDLSVPEDMS